MRAPAGKRRGHRARGAAGQQPYFPTLGWGLHRCPPRSFAKVKPEDSWKSDNDLFKGGRGWEGDFGEKDLLLGRQAAARAWGGGASERGGHREGPEPRGSAHVY